MDSQVLLTIDDQPISLRQSISYLQSSGQWNAFIWHIVCQHVIEQELQEDDNWNGNDLDLAVEQTIFDVRLDNNLKDSTTFEEWLEERSLDCQTFRSQLVNELKKEQIKTRFLNSKLHQYFIEKKVFLDQVLLSRLAVESQSLAEELKSQVLEDGVAFEQLIKQHFSKKKELNCIRESFSRGRMSDKLRTIIDSADLGEIIGPIQLDEVWFLIRIDQFLPAELDESLEDELFDLWINEKVQAKTVRLQVT